METRRVSEGESLSRFALANASGYFDLKKSLSRSREDAESSGCGVFDTCSCRWKLA